MSPRDRLSGLVCGLTLLVAGYAVATESPEAASPASRQSLRGAKTIHLEVRQEYIMEEEPGEEMSGEETDQADKTGQAMDGKEQAGAAQPAEEKPLENFSLPLAGLAEEAVRLTGWKPAGPDQAAELTLTVDVHGTPIGTQYVGSLSGFFYTGAELHGTVRLEREGKVVTEEVVSAEIPVAMTITSTSMFGYRGGPRDAPFHRTLPEYCEAVFTVIGRACGPEPVVAGLTLENDDQRTGAGLALLEVGDPSVEPALIKILGQNDGTLSRIAALGLAVHGSPAALPSLLAALRMDKSHEGRPPADDDYLLSSLGTEPDEIVPLAERASRARELAGRPDLESAGGPEELHRAVEWALLQIEAPGKLDRLTAALQERDAVMLRRGAAIVLGSMGDERAFGPLAIAAQDKEPLVRAAALAALGWLKNERAVDILLGASADTTGYVSKLAREQLATIGEDRWDKFRQSQNRTEALRKGFEHPDPLVRAAAVRAVDYDPGPEIMAALAALLRSDPQALVREAVVETLADKGDDKCAPLLADALADTDAATRRRAVQALAIPSSDEEDPDKMTGRNPLPETALEPLLALVARQEVDESEAKALLERIEGPGVADKLWQAIQKDLPPQVLRLVAARIAARGDKRAGPRLLTLLGKATEPYAGQFAADALVALDDPAMLDTLFVQLKSGTPAARRLVVNVLSRLREPRAIGPLIAACRAGEKAGPNDAASGLAGEAREALKALTGQSYENSEQWLSWWKAHAGQPLIKPPPEPAPD